MGIIIYQDTRPEKKTERNLTVIHLISKNITSIKSYLLFEIKKKYLIIKISD